MSGLPTGLSQADFDLYAHLDKAIKDLTEERKVLGDKIKKHLEPGAYVFGDVIVDRQEKRVVDAKALSAAYSVAEFPGFYKQVLDATAVPAEIKQKFQTIQHSLSVKKTS